MVRERKRKRQGPLETLPLRGRREKLRVYFISC
jgi:hypothetical protein